MLPISNSHFAVCLQALTGTTKKQNCCRQQLPVTSQHNRHNNCKEEHILPTAQTGIVIHSGCF